MATTTKICHREIHHMCLLLGYGADAICPFLVLQMVRRLRDQGLLDQNLTNEDIYVNYRAACARGISKVMAKMGISTLHSYKVGGFSFSLGYCLCKVGDFSFSLGYCLCIVGDFSFSLGYWCKVGGFSFERWYCLCKIGDFSCSLGYCLYQMDGFSF